MNTPDEPFAPSPVEAGPLPAPPVDPSAVQPFASTEPESIPDVAPPAEEQPLVQPRGGAKKAALWTILGFITMYVLKFEFNILMAKQLAPEMFGLLTLVGTFITGLHMFSDVGIIQAIITSKRGDDPAFLNTAWTMQVVRGVILWLAALAIAWPVALFYDVPEMLLLMPVVGFNEIISGLNSTALLTLGRRLYRGRIVLMEIVAYLAQMAVALIWVYYWKNVWAIVAGGMTSALLTMLWSHWLLPGFHNRFRWEKPAVHELFHFGKWIMISTVFTFLASQSDRLVVGKVSLTQLGLYYFALMIASIPSLLISTLTGQLFFPLYSRFKNEGRDVREAFGRIHLPATILAAVLVTGVFASGPPLVRCMYDFRYQEAGWIMQFLAVSAWLQILAELAGTVLLARGQPRALAISNGVKAIALPTFGLLGLYLGHFQGMLCGFIAADLVRYLTTVWFVHKEGLTPWRSDLPLTGLFALFSAIGAYVAQLPSVEENKYVQFLVAGWTVVLLWGVVAVVCRWRGLLKLSLAPGR